MKRILCLCTALSLSAAFVGCSEETEVKKETTVTTPEGETTTTETTTVEQSGDNPPAPANP